MPHHPTLTLEHAELTAWLRLSLTPSLGPAAIRRLLAHFGSPEAVWQQPASAWRECLSAAQAQQLTRTPETLHAAVERTWQWLQHDDAHGTVHALITLGDPRYPPALWQMADPPLFLYAMGAARWLQRAAPLLDTRRTLAMVGSRNPTGQGRENARAFGCEMAQQGWCVVSGMAAGIDAAAHTGALQAIADTGMGTAASDQPVTVAVVGTGVDRIYPRQNEALARHIALHGVIVSEYALGTPPIAHHFPQRNRIIAGMAWGTLVVEAAVASGSLITARLAAEQGREVFAIPGSIHAPQSKGCHALLRQGAKLVECAQDIWEELPHTPSEPRTDPTPSDSNTLADTTAEEHPLWQALGYDPMTLDALQAHSGWDMAALQAWLLEQELEGRIAQLPGGRIQRMART